MNGTRLSIRLDGRRTAFLQRLCRELGCGTSEAVRRALDRFAMPNVGGNADSASQAQVARSDFPPVPHMPAPSPDVFLASADRPTPTPAVEGCETLPSMPAAPVPPYAQKNVQLPNFKAFGAKLPEERRRLFHHLYAAAKVISESSDNPRDAALRDELMLIGREYNQL
jgi:hypothetical protein